MVKIGKLRVEYFTFGFRSGSVVARYNGLLWKPWRLERFIRSPPPSTSNAGWVQIASVEDFKPFCFTG
jgi:hypothetical protein